RAAASVAGTFASMNLYTSSLLAATNCTWLLWNGRSSAPWRTRTVSPVRETLVPSMSLSSFKTTNRPESTSVGTRGAAVAIGGGSGFAGAVMGAWSTGEVTGVGGLGGSSAGGTAGLTGSGFTGGIGAIATGGTMSAGLGGEGSAGTE